MSTLRQHTPKKAYPFWQKIFLNKPPNIGHRPYMYMTSKYGVPTPHPRNSKLTVWYMYLYCNDIHNAVVTKWPSDSHPRIRDRSCIILIALVNIWQFRHLVAFFNDLWLCGRLTVWQAPCHQRDCRWIRCDHVTEWQYGSLPGSYQSPSLLTCDELAEWLWQAPCIQWVYTLISLLTCDHVPDWLWQAPAL